MGGLWKGWKLDEIKRLIFKSIAEEYWNKGIISVHTPPVGEITAYTRHEEARPLNRDLLMKLGQNTSKLTTDRNIPTGIPQATPKATTSSNNTLEPNVPKNPSIANSEDAATVTTPNKSSTKKATPAGSMSRQVSARVSATEVNMAQRGTKRNTINDEEWDMAMEEERGSQKRRNKGVPDNRDRSDNTTLPRRTTRVLRISYQLVIYDCEDGDDLVEDDFVEETAMATLE